MESNTLYYFFSTVAQVMAAISALLAVFTHFKVNEIKDFLVGDGEATYKRMKSKRTGYTLPDEVQHGKYLRRLGDAVGRKSILGILEVLNLLAKYESEAGRTVQTNPRGLQYLELRFAQRMKQMMYIKYLTKRSVLSAFISIFIAMISILFVECLATMNIIKWVVIFVVLAPSFLSMLYSVKGIILGLQNQEDV